MSENIVDRKKFSTTINWPKKIEDDTNFIHIDIVCSNSFNKATKEWQAEWKQKVEKHAKGAIKTAGRDHMLFGSTRACPYRFSVAFYTKNEYTGMLWDQNPVRYNGIKFKHPTSHGRELVDDLKDLKRAQKQDLKNAQKRDLKKAQKHIAKAYGLITC